MNNIIRLILPILVMNNISVTWAGVFDGIIPQSIVSLAEDPAIMQPFLANVTGPTFADLAMKNGKPCETFEVETADGYLLTLFRIPGDFSKPVLCIHAVLDSADAFIERGPDSLAITLSNNGYDVWVGNLRGNRYSRKHIKYNPDKDSKEFFDFSLHEMGSGDIPAIIDFILNKTGQKKLSVIGHSYGAATVLIAASENPQINDKINIFIALAPSTFTSHMKGMLRLAFLIPRNILNLIQNFDIHEILGNDDLWTRLIRSVCSSPTFGYDVCIKSVLFALVGENPDDFEREFTPTFAKHFFSGTSLKTLIHIYQNGSRKRFAMYDHGRSKNRKLYGGTSPTDYELNEVKMNVCIYAGKNDHYSDKEDIEKLKGCLPNVVHYELIEKEAWNHFDFIIGRTMSENLYPSLLKQLKKYN